jgi:hypothetical protein
MNKVAEDRQKKVLARKQGLAAAEKRGRQKVRRAAMAGKKQGKY